MGEIKDFYRLRMNCFAYTYCEIAMESFFDASKHYDTIKKTITCEKCQKIIHKCKKGL